jgi:hypothetical protein
MVGITSTLKEALNTGANIEDKRERIQSIIISKRMLQHEIRITY